MRTNPPEDQDSYSGVRTAGPLCQIARTLQVDIVSCTPIPGRRIGLRTNYMVRTSGGEYVLKLYRSQSHSGRLSCRNEISVYNSLAKTDFSHFKYPTLVETDRNSYMVTKFIGPGWTDRSSSRFRSHLVESILEFQTAVSEPQRNRMADRAMLQLARRPVQAILRRAMTFVRSRYGVCASASLVRVASACSAAQPPLGRSFLLHNDFHENNLLIGRDGGIYISDFESVVIERKWIVADILHYAVSRERFEIDVALVQDYLSRLADRLTNGSCISKPAQIRIGLLKRVLQHLASPNCPDAARGAYEEFFMGTLLTDRAFERWYRQEFVA